MAKQLSFLWLFVLAMTTSLFGRATSTELSPCEALGAICSVRVPRSPGSHNKGAGSHKKAPQSPGRVKELPVSPSHPPAVVAASVKSSGGSQSALKSATAAATIVVIVSLV